MKAVTGQLVRCCFVWFLGAFTAFYPAMARGCNFQDGDGRPDFLRRIVHFDINELSDHVTGRFLPEECGKAGRVQGVHALNHASFPKICISDTVGSELWSWRVLHFQEFLGRKVSSGYSDLSSVYADNDEGKQIVSERVTELDWRVQLSTANSYSQGAGYFVGDCIGCLRYRPCLGYGAPRHLPYIVPSGTIRVEAGRDKPKPSIMLDFAGRRRGSQGKVTNLRIGAHYNGLGFPDHNSGSPMLSHRTRVQEQCDGKKRNSGWTAIWIHGGEITEVVRQCVKWLP